jgi:hypothetical protein
MDDGKPCQCAAEGEDKCDLITRLTVALPELTTLLGWRLESKGENAARELLGSLELVQGVAQGRPFVPAKLRIVERRGNKDGQPTRYVVPVLDCQVSYETLARALPAGNGPEGYKPIAAMHERGSLREALTAAMTKTAHVGRQAAPIPDANGLEFTDQPIPVPDDTPGREITETKRLPAATLKQKKQLDVLVGQLREAASLRTTHLYWAVANLRGVDLDEFTPEDPHWGPLRDQLSKDEASNLIDRLGKLQAAE